MKIGFALGGGGAKGFFHIGALRALEKLKIKPDIIAGTSIGAMMGGAYSLYPKADHLEKVIFEVYDKYSKDILGLKVFSASSSIEEKKLFLEKSFGFVKDLFLWNLRIIKPFLVDSHPFMRMLKDIFKTSRFSDCKIPFIATAVELTKGEKTFFKTGPLYKAVLASLALPGVFPPLKIHDQLFADGGVVMPLPVEAIKKEVDFLIGVNVEDGNEIFREASSAIDMMFYADRMRYREIVKYNKARADFVISPNLDDFHWADFDKVRGLVKRGEKETLDVADELLKALGKQRVKSIFLPRILRRKV
jgi:NTE family protein